MDDMGDSHSRRPKRRLTRLQGRVPNRATAEEVAFHQRAMHKAKIGQSRHAIRMLKRGRELYPHNAFFPHSIAILLVKSRQYDAARNHFNLALKVDACSAPSLQAWALMEAKLGNGPLARDLFQRAAEVRRCPSISPLLGSVSWYVCRRSKLSRIRKVNVPLA